MKKKKEIGKTIYSFEKSKSEDTATRLGGQNVVQLAKRLKEAFFSPPRRSLTQCYVFRLSILRATTLITLPYAFTHPFPVAE